MAFGTFDNFHPGHQSYLAQAGAFGNEIFVIVARDKNVLKIKGHLPQENEAIRHQKVAAALKNLGLIGEARLGSLTDSWQAVRELRPNFICLGYDQPADVEALQELASKECFFCEIKRLEPFFPEKYKSSFCLGNL